MISATSRGSRSSMGSNGGDGYRIKDVATNRPLRISAGSVFKKFLLHTPLRLDRAMLNFYLTVHI